MKLPRILFLITLLLTTSLPTTAAQGVQDVATGEDKDPVTDTINNDRPDACDDTGWSLLSEELTVEADDEFVDQMDHFGACQFDVHAILWGACVEPITDDVMENLGPLTIRPGEAFVLCDIVIMSTRDNEIHVNVEDFAILDEHDNLSMADPEIQNLFDTTAWLQSMDIQPNDITSGRLLFIVDDSITSPFLLLWRPTTPVEQRTVAIIVDRLITLEEAMTSNTDN